MLFLQGGTASRWPATAVHDTVAAIARQAVYRRKLTDTLWDRFWSWVGDRFNDIAELLKGVGGGRDVATWLVVLLIALVIVRMVIAARAAQDTASNTSGRTRRLLGTDPWGDAERFAAAGRFTEAAHSLFAALLAAIAARGEVRFHASKTAGDYAREMRRRGTPSFGGFQAFRARYDRVIYLAGVCTADDYAALLDQARPLLEQRRAA
jgi:hypothetical protein